MSFLPSFKNIATLRNKWKLAAVSRETPENARNSQAQNTFVPGMTEEYITQVSEQTENRVTGTLSGRNLAEQHHVFWVLCPNLTNFFWTHKYGHAPKLFRDHPRTMTSKTGKPLEIVTRVIFIPKWSSLFVRSAIQRT